MRTLLDLDAPDETGTTKRSRLRHLWEQHGRWDDQITAPEIPAVARYAWERFWQLRGENGIPYAEIDAYQRLTGDRMLPWEIDLIRAMARAEAAHHAERIRNARRS